MSPPELLERPGVLEIRSPMKVGARMLLAVVGCVPWLAPYELLFKPQWEHGWHPVFWMAVLISAGAMAVSALLFFAAVAGLDSRVVLDRTTGTIRHAWKAPVIRRSTRVYPLDALRKVDVCERTWSDSAPSYYLRFELCDGHALETASSSTRAEVEGLRERVVSFLSPMDGVFGKTPE